MELFILVAIHLNQNYLLSIRDANYCPLCAPWSSQKKQYLMSQMFYPSKMSLNSPILHMNRPRFINCQEQLRQECQPVLKTHCSCSSLDPIIRCYNH